VQSALSRDRKLQEVVQRQPPPDSELVGNGGSAGFESGNWHPERGTGHVVQPDLMEEPHTVRVTTMFAPNPDLQPILGAVLLL
jgi:hypothetical protein